jgi:hypothetical protein
MLLRSTEENSKDSLAFLLRQQPDHCSVSERTREPRPSRLQQDTTLTNSRRLVQPPLFNCPLLLQVEWLRLLDRLETCLLNNTMAGKRAAPGVTLANATLLDNY